MFTISASTVKAGVAVTRDDARDALDKIREFEDLGLYEVAVTTEAGRAVTREQLSRLAAVSVAHPAERPA